MADKSLNLVMNVIWNSMNSDQAITHINQMKGAINGVTAAAGANVSQVNRLTGAINQQSTSVRKLTSISNNIIPVYDKQNKLLGNITNQTRAYTSTVMVNGKAIKQTTRETMRLGSTVKTQAGAWGVNNVRLDGAIKRMNALRWSMVNVAFALGGIALLLSPIYLLGKAGVEWELQLKRIQIVTDQLNTSMLKLSNTMIDLRKNTPFSRTETADAFLEFAKAGFSAEKAIEALPHIQALAVAGFTDLAQATIITATTLHAFAVEGVTAAQVASVIAESANKSALDVETFGVAMSYVAPIAANLGFTFEETAAALSLLSNAGLASSKAGTTLGQVFNKIADPSVEAAKLMERIGISYFNAAGEARDLAGAMDTLAFALEHMNEEEKASTLGTLFNIRARKGVAAFLNLIEEGSGGIDEFNKGLDKTHTYHLRAMQEAMDTSANRMKSALNDLKDAFLPIGIAINDMLIHLIKIGEVGAKAIGSVTKALGPVGSTALAVGATGGAVAVGKKIYDAFIKRGSNPANPVHTLDSGLGKFAAGIAAGQAANLTAIKVLAPAGSGIAAQVAARGAYGGVLAAGGTGAATGAAAGGTAGFFASIGGAVTAFLASPALPIIIAAVAAAAAIYFVGKMAVDTFAPKTAKYMSEAEKAAFKEDQRKRASAPLALGSGKASLSELELKQLAASGNIIAMSALEEMKLPERPVDPNLFQDVVYSVRDGTEEIKGVWGTFFDDVKTFFENSAESERRRKNMTPLQIADQQQAQDLYFGPDKGEGTMISLELQPGTEFFYEKMQRDMETAKQERIDFAEYIDRLTKVSADAREISQTALQKLIESPLLKGFDPISKILDAWEESSPDRGQLDKALENAIQKGTVDQVKKIEESLADLDALDNAKDKLKEYYDEAVKLTDLVKILKDSQAEHSRQIEEQTKLLNNAKDTLDSYKDSLDRVNDAIDLLVNARFTGQSATEALLQDLETYQTEQELASFGILDAQAFINTALEASESGYDSLIAKVQELTSETLVGKTAYEAWQETVKEFIRSAIEQGNLMNANTSGAIKAFQTTLMSTTKFGDDTSATEETINLLKMSYDVHYGDMQNSVEQAIQAHEDEKNGVYDTAVEVVAALNNQWIAQDRWEKKVEESEAIVYDYNLAIINLKEDYEALGESISDTTDDINDYIESARRAAEYGMSRFSTGRSAGNVTYNTNQNDNSNYGGTIAFDTGGSITMSKGFAAKVKEAQDAGLMADGGLVTRPTLAMVGEGGPELVIPLSELKAGGGLGGGTTVSIGQISVSGVSGNASDFAYAFAEELRRELSTQ